VRRNVLQASDARTPGALLATPPLRPLATSPKRRATGLAASRRSVHIREARCLSRAPCLVWHPLRHSSRVRVTALKVESSNLSEHDTL